MPFRVAAEIALLLTLAAAANAEDAGRVCLGPAPTPTGGERSLANPTGGLPDVSYSVRIDQRPSAALKRTSGSWVTDLNLDDRHTVIIFQEGRQVQSFHFRFAEPELCLFLAPLYETWQLWPLSRLPDGCGCSASPAA